MSRASLQQRMKQLLGRTLHDEIKRVHIDRAKYLLAQTDIPIAEVAKRSGFGNLTWFSESFHTANGMSPAAYRKKFQK